MARYTEDFQNQDNLLTPEQQSQINSLKEELSYYRQLLNKTKQKRNKIQEVFDNYDNIIAGNIIVSILPDENLDEIKNSVIISKQEISNKLNNIEVADPNNSQNENSQDSFSSSNFSEYSPSDITKVNNLLNDIFDRNIIVELIQKSSILNENELYAPIYYQMINESNMSISAKDLFTDIIAEIESLT